MTWQVDQAPAARYPFFVWNDEATHAADRYLEIKGTTRVRRFLTEANAQRAADKLNRAAAARVTASLLHLRHERFTA